MMKYRWKKSTDRWEDDTWNLYLILDGKKYMFAVITWYEHVEEWEVFIAGFVCEDQVHVEKPYKLLCDAKADVMDYAKVWWITGEYQRNNEDELRQWRESTT
jgi:hypothetical protein